MQIALLALRRKALEAPAPAARASPSREVESPDVATCRHVFQLTGYVPILGKGCLYFHVVSKSKNNTF